MAWRKPRPTIVRSTYLGLRTYSVHIDSLVARPTSLIIDALQSCRSWPPLFLYFYSTIFLTFNLTATFLLAWHSFMSSCRLLSVSPIGHSSPQYHLRLLEHSWTPTRFSRDGQTPDSVDAALETYVGSLTMIQILRRFCSRYGYFFPLSFVPNRKSCHIN